MANKRALSWSVAMRDIQNDRARRSDVREERLRTATSLRGTPALPLSAWRGQSGRRYVVGIHALDDDPSEVGDAVVIAVRRGGDGTAELVAVTSAGETPRERLARGWLTRARARGATEMHVHRLAEDAAARRAVVADLGGAVA
ncbi:hypothetical protein [Methylobacterium ajmalii]|jgi:hypothetical protein|uniref:hypothetical protein n=2 Tax=Methylobacterium ajmalii TaxID=2738439 RepID=UPI0008DF9E07|nr:hypothetical protein [Methylobacterium ajmalii]MBK3399417.1 hypothetical protein [Methylobacterium ajmalii]MBK3406960.1 hypothetical protein [Methylobacterium ajmalii]MBZ6411338.1 hypothetical protein [Methylobacterium sp.]SFE54208.1 hypothetical protein SAMN04487844_10452 [Methylobacterium sp. yr596]